MLWRQNYLLISHLYLSSAHHFWVYCHVVTKNASYTLSCIIRRVSRDTAFQKEY